LARELLRRDVDDVALRLLGIVGPRRLRARTPPGGAHRGQPTQFFSRFAPARSSGGLIAAIPRNSRPATSRRRASGRRSRVASAAACTGTRRRRGTGEAWTAPPTRNRWPPRPP